MAETANIPVIDISADGEGRQQVAKELVEAAVSHGFIYIKDTGKDIPVESVDAAFEMVGWHLSIIHQSWPVDAGSKW